MARAPGHPGAAANREGVTLYYILDLAFRVAYLLILARVVVSWLPVSRWHPIVRWLYAVTEPFLAPFRRLLPPWRTGGLDLSPFLLIITLSIVRRLL